MALLKYTPRSLTGYLYLTGKNGTTLHIGYIAILSLFSGTSGHDTLRATREWRRATCGRATSEGRRAEGGEGIERAVGRGGFMSVMAMLQQLSSIAVPAQA